MSKDDQLFAIRLANRFDGEYDIQWIHYRNVYGELIGKEPMFYKRLYAVGQTFVADYIQYRVVRVAVADKIQHVNVERIGSVKKDGE